MKTACTLILLFIVGASYAQVDNKIVIGTVDSMYSTILGEQRKIWVYVPNAAENSIYSASRYPVVYLLDGDAHFHSVTGLIQQLSTINGNTMVPEMIVVGIVNTNRTRDLTPTHSLLGPDGKPMGFDTTSGGGVQFMSFMEKELMPYIESKYPVQPYKMLVGHSLGGLMVVNTVVNKPELFSSYLAIDPSLWWDNQALLKQSLLLLKQKKFSNKPLYVAIANTMSEGADFKRVSGDTSAITMHIRSNLELVKALDKYKGGQPWNWKYYNDDTHGSVPLIAEYDAMRTFFKKYPSKTPTSPGDTSLNAAYMQEHYKDVSEIFGYKVVPPENSVNGLAYFYLQTGKHKLAKELFQLNIDNYPQSFNVYDSMGDYYTVTENKKQAIELFSKALTLRDFPDTRKKLEALQSGK
jgi:predicted alpha/beta superfamily hydrolase